MPSSVLVLAAAEGTNEEIDAAVRPFVTDVMASGRPSWRPELQALAVPLTREGAPPFGALVLMGRQDAADADLLAACERIAARIARRSTHNSQLATNK